MGKMDATTRRPPAGPPTRRARGAAQENFPVGSVLLPAPLRAPVRAFYEVVRAADDIADDPEMEATDKTARLDAIEAGLRGDAAGDARSTRLRRALAECGHPGAEHHAIAMLAAFRADVAARPCQSWADLDAYCRASANPVGHFLLDLHGETPDTHTASNALCTVLQILNHLQDLGEDWRDLGRVYLPGDWLEAAGAVPSDLGRPALTPELRAAVDRTLDACTPLMARAAALPGLVRSRRLRAEIRSIETLARRLHAHLSRRDPLAERVALARADWWRAGLRGTTTLLAPARFA
ncbi:squalene/phytoene synthase family protein (plasmid) [Limimaricola litoreus]